MIIFCHSVISVDTVYIHTLTLFKVPLCNLILPNTAERKQKCHSTSSHVCENPTIGLLNRTVDLENRCCSSRCHMCVLGSSSSSDSLSIFGAVQMTSHPHNRVFLPAASNSQATQWNAALRPETCTVSKV